MLIQDLIKAYFKNEKLNIEYSKELTSKAIEQALQPFLYPVTNCIEYKKYYVSYLIKQQQFFNIQDELTKIFNDSKINHFFMKGSIISKYYSDPALRTRGDIDIYVSLNDFLLAKNVLIKNNFLENEKISDCMHHVEFFKNNITVELHFSLFDSDVPKSWKNTFDKPFNVCVNENNYLYKMDDTYHFIYCILHFSHHLRHGAGLRYIIDFYYLIKSTNINNELKNKLINDLKINVLYENIINAIYYLTDELLDESVKLKDITFFIDYLLKYGIHGYANNQTKANSSIHHNKITYFLKRVFITDKSYRLARYPRLGKYKILYPLCVLRHIIYLLKNKFKSFLVFLFGKNKNKKLYKRLGV